MEFKIKRILAIQKLPKMLPSSIDRRTFFFFISNNNNNIVVIIIQNKLFTTSY